MILNLAGFRIELSPAGDPNPCRLSVNHASLLSKGPADYTLAILYSDLPLFDEPVSGYSPFSFDLPRLAQGVSEWFWKMDYSGNQIRLQGTYPGGQPGTRWEMKIDPFSGQGELRVPIANRYLDPVQYPVDALLIYYLALFTGGIIIHASGAGFNGSCSVFVGESGAGKSTIARYCQIAGARILHDDRIVIRKAGEQFTAYRMPVYPGSLPASMPLETIYFIEQSASIYEIPLPPQVAFEKLTGNTVQHPFHSELVRRQVSNVAAIVETVPCFRLGFPPDPEVGRYLCKPAATGTGFAWKPVTR